MTDTNTSPATATDAHFRQFLRESPTRYDLDGPWVANGLEFFSNSHVLVWRPTDKPDSQGKTIPIRSRRLVFDPEEIDGWHDFPKLPDECRPRRIACPRCDGTGLNQCPTCGRGGNDACQICDGQGDKLKAPKPFASLFGYPYSSRELWKLQGLHDVQCVVSTGHWHNLLVRFNGGAGVLCASATSVAISEGCVSVDVEVIT
jgi:hypothetical protein